MDSTLLLSIITIGSGVIGLIIRYTFRSKCTSVVCCFGLCHIERDIQRELEIEAQTHEARTDSPVSPTSTSPLSIRSPETVTPASRSGSRHLNL